MSTVKIDMARVAALCNIIHESDLGQDLGMRIPVNGAWWNDAIEDWGDTTPRSACAMAEINGIRLFYEAIYPTAANVSREPLYGLSGRDWYILFGFRLYTSWEPDFKFDGSQVELMRSIGYVTDPRFAGSYDAFMNDMSLLKLFVGEEKLVEYGMNYPEIDPEKRPPCELRVVNRGVDCE